MSRRVFLAVQTGALSALLEASAEGKQRYDCSGFFLSSSCIPCASGRRAAYGLGFLFRGLSAEHGASRVSRS